MPIHPLVLELLERVIETGLSAEEVCENRPELIGEVRACLNRFSSVQNELDALFPEEDASDPVQGSRSSPEIPGYAIGEVIGRGGMGVVYKARQLRLNRQVAVKMMLNGSFAGPPELARFQQEAEALGALQHPNIVQVHDVGEAGGLPYFTMEFLDGGNLAQKLGGVPLSPSEAASLMIQLADAVEAAHRGGVVHRDLKPSNILLTANGTPKLTDFGLARRLDVGVGMSMTATRIGTPGYMAPEQVAGHSRVSGAAADVYSLGAVFYELLTGRPPFRAETVAETERQVIAEEPAPPSRLNAKIPRDLETICLKCLRKEPRRRYSSAAELGEDVGRFRRGEPIRARPVGWAERAGKWTQRHPARAVSMISGLMVSISLLVGGWWLMTTRSAISRAVEDDLKVATNALRQSNWGEARSALERAQVRLGTGGSALLRQQLNRAVLDQDLVVRLAAIRMDRLSRAEEGRVHLKDAYADAFRDAGLLYMDEAPQVMADRLGRSDIRDALVAAIDDWALCDTFLADVSGEDSTPDRSSWLLAVARKADPDPDGWRDRLRDPSVRHDKHKLASLAGSAKLSETPVNLLAALGELMRQSGGDAVPFLLTVQQHHPDDLWVNYLLGSLAQQRNDIPEALRNLQAALAARPKTAFLHRHLGVAFHRAGRLDESLFHFTKAVQLEPEDDILRSNFGDCLMESNRIAEAAEQYKRGLDCARDAPARSSLERLLMRCWMRSAKAQEVDEFWRRSLRRVPPLHEDWDGYAEFCLFQDRLDDYLATCRGLIDHFGTTSDPQIAERTGRACLLSPASTETLEQATALIDRALADKRPELEWALPYFMVAKGLAEYRHGRLESAISIMDGPAKTALQSVPGLVLAMAQHRLGRKDEALKTFEAAISVGDWEKSHAYDREKWMYHILRREAEAVLMPYPPSSSQGK